MTGTSDATNELTLLRELVSTLQQENALLRQKVEALIRRVFGSSSERLDPAQLELLLQLAGSGKASVIEAPRVERTAAESPRSRKARAQRIPENLPVVEEVIDPEPVLTTPQEWRLIGQEVSEQLDYEPARFLRRRTIRRKYVHTSDPDRPPIMAPLPEKLQERGVAGPGLLAHIVVSKYCDHLPLYRQEQIFAQRHKINLPRQSLARWMELCADWLQPIYEHIRTGVLAGGYVQADETPIEYLAPGNGQTKQGYLWTCSRPGGDVFYRWETSRAAECLGHLLGQEFNGLVQCDGYSGYRAFAQRSQEIELCGCWAHVRRKFRDALEQTPGRTGWILRQIQHLYRIEARLRESQASPALRQSVRSHQSRPIVERLRKVLLLCKSSRRHLPQSLLGQAIDYALGQWTTLEVYLEDGRVEIDNNLVENAIRPTAIGKKNWLFIGEAGAGQRGAILYTIIESCRRRKIDPYGYLRDLLTRLPHMTNQQIPEVTPAAWTQAQRKLSRTSRS
ncbi:MAG TPA: IS66 family transposase [Methylomirabilota bacterium]|nr:IS66 family transposase [Methylomirabilota bacterium]